jgi:protein PsiE
MTAGWATMPGTDAPNRDIAQACADILLMFLYLEVIGMVSVYYARRNSVFVYPIFIAITAVGRLVVLQGKEMEPVNILIEAAAILLLSISALVIIWAIGQQAARLHPS